MLMTHAASRAEAPRFVLDRGQGDADRSLVQEGQRKRAGGSGEQCGPAPTTMTVHACATLPLRRASRHIRRTRGAAAELVPAPRWIAPSPRRRTDRLATALVVDKR